MGVQKFDGKSPEITAEQHEKLKQLFPEAFAEDKVDFDKLKAALGEEVDLGERYGLSWKGKSNVFRAIQEPTTKTLRPIREESVNFDETDNVFIEGDNLEVLKTLQRAYYGKIKMIYIDPPYNTGNDFVYNDKFAQTQEEYAQETGLKDENGSITRTDGLHKNSKDGGHFHSNWLNMMYPRLYLARNLLRQDGVIFVSIDDNEVHNLRMIMNEIFGEENFMAQITALLNPRGRNLDDYVAKTHEYLLVYGRDISLGDSIEKLAKTDAMINEYNKHDERGDYRLIELRNRNPAFNRLTRPNLYYSIFVDIVTKKVSLLKDNQHSVEVLPNDSRGESTCWTWGQGKFTDQIDLLLAVETKGGWRVYRKDYFEDEEGNASKTLPKTVWLEKEINHDYGKTAIKELFNENIMSFPKSVQLIDKILRLGAGKDSLVLDFFAGSATTAQAVMQLNHEDEGNRKYICVQLPEETNEDSEACKAGYKNIADIAKERIRRAGKKIQKEQVGKLKLEDGRLDLGFKVLKLDSSNFKAWNTDISEPDELKKQAQLHLNPIKDDASEEDLLFEIMIKNGIEPTAKREKIEEYWNINEGELIICLAKSISQDLFQQMVNQQPKKVIILDKSLATDQSKTNLTLQAEKSNIEILVV